jgi:hypothetical protein
VSTIFPVRGVPMPGLNPYDSLSDTAALDHSTTGEHVFVEGGVSNMPSTKEQLMLPFIVSPTRFSTEWRRRRRSHEEAARTADRLPK